MGHGKGVISSFVKKKSTALSMPCEVAIYRMVEKSQATDSLLDKIKYEIICFYFVRNDLHQVWM
jgi:hypothetical protein